MAALATQSQPILLHHPNLKIFHLDSLGHFTNYLKNQILIQGYFPHGMNDS
jgi:hypothetical protein